MEEINSTPDVLNTPRPPGTPGTNGSATPNRLHERNISSASQHSYGRQHDALLPDQSLQDDHELRLLPRTATSTSMASRLSDNDRPTSHVGKSGMVIMPS